MALVKTYDANGNVVMVDPTKPSRPKMTEYGVLEGFTPWGTPITDGRTTAEWAAEAQTQASQSIADQLANLGYTAPTGGIKPGTSYQADSSGLLNEITKPKVTPEPETTSMVGKTTFGGVPITEDYDNRPYKDTRTNEIVYPDGTRVPDWRPGPADWVDESGQPHWNEFGGGSTPPTTPTTPETPATPVTPTTPETPTPTTPTTPTTPEQPSTPSQDYLNDILEQIMGSEFTYDPSNDPALQQAQEYAANQVLQQMSARNMFRSSYSQDALTEAMNQLIPQYEQMAYQRYQDNLNNLYDAAGLYMDIDQINYAREMDARQMQIDEEERALRAEQDAREQAWDRLETLGYIATNDDATLLGMPVGTPSEDMRMERLRQEQAADAQLQALQSEKDQLEQESLGVKRQAAYNVVAGSLAQMAQTDPIGMVEFVDYARQLIAQGNIDAVREWARLYGKDLPEGFVTALQYMDADSLSEVIENMGELTAPPERDDTYYGEALNYVLPKIADRDNPIAALGELATGYYKNTQSDDPNDWVSVDEYQELSPSERERYTYEQAIDMVDYQELVDRVDEILSSQYGIDKLKQSVSGGTSTDALQDIADRIGLSTE